MRPSLSLQTLLAGDLDYSTALASGARASVSGLPLLIVMSLTVGQDFSLVVRPEIHRMEDLKGKTLAVSGVGEFTDVGARMVLKKYGLVPEKDVKLRALYGNHPLRLSALQARQIDGTVMSMPYNKMAVKLGFKELVHLREVIKTPQGGLVTTVQRIRGEPDLIRRAIKAALMGNRFLKENKGEFVKLLAKESGIHDPTVADLVYEEAVKLYSDTGLISDEAMHEFIAASKESLKISREVAVSEVALGAESGKRIASGQISALYWHFSRHYGEAFVDADKPKKGLVSKLWGKFRTANAGLDIHLRFRV